MLFLILKITSKNTLATPLSRHLPRYPYLPLWRLLPPSASIVIRPPASPLQQQVIGWERAPDLGRANQILSPGIFGIGPSAYGWLAEDAALWGHVNLGLRPPLRMCRESGRVTCKGTGVIQRSMRAIAPGFPTSASLGRPYHSNQSHCVCVCKSVNVLKKEGLLLLASFTTLTETNTL